MWSDFSEEPQPLEELLQDFKPPVTVQLSNVEAVASTTTTDSTLLDTDITLSEIYQSRFLSAHIIHGGLVIFKLITSYS